MAENIARLFKEETRYQKSVARGDRCRKKGGGRKCTLGVDNMTNSEIEKRNGPVITYDGRVGTFSDFVRMDKTEQVSFLDRMQYLYEVNPHSLSQIWGIQYSKFTSYLSSVGITMRPAYPTKMQKEEIKRMIEEKKNNNENLDVRAIGHTEFSGMTVESRTAYVQQICDKFNVSMAAVYMAIYNTKSVKAAANLLKRWPIDRSSINSAGINNPKDLGRLMDWYMQNSPEMHVPYKRNTYAKKNNKLQNTDSVVIQPEVVTAQSEISDSKGNNQELAKPVPMIVEANNSKLSGEITLEGNTISEIIKKLQHLQNLTDTAEIMVYMKL